MAYWYSKVRTQVSRKAKRTRKQSRRSFPKQDYVQEPRFDVVARHPVLQTERVVECKEYTTNVSADLVEGFAYRLWLCKIPYRHGIIAARPALTDGARKCADRFGLTCWDGSKLERKLIVGAGLNLAPIKTIERTIRYARR